MAAGRLFSAGASAFASRNKIAARPSSSAALRPASGCVVDRLRPGDRHRGRGGRGPETTGESTMATIGTFTRSNGNTYTGAVKTLSINAKITIKPAEKASDKAPDYRIFANQVELGAAWKKTSGEGREYLSVKLGDPSFPAPIYATLIEAEEPGAYSLVWSRSAR